MAAVRPAACSAARTLRHAHLDLLSPEPEADTLGSLRAAHPLADLLVRRTRGNADAFEANFLRLTAVVRCGRPAEGTAVLAGPRLVAQSASRRGAGEVPGATRARVAVRGVTAAGRRDAPAAACVAVLPAPPGRPRDDRGDGGGDERAADQPQRPRAGHRARNAPRELVQELAQDPVDPLFPCTGGLARSFGRV
jgi:hypothetical protein